MKNILKTLEQHNSMNFTIHRGLFPPSPVFNGIACPKCGEELLDTKPNETLTSIPPKKNVGCSSDKCDYTGYRIA
jgi:hypothetical protein